MKWILILVATCLSPNAGMVREIPVATSDKQSCEDVGKSIAEMAGTISKNDSTGFELGPVLTYKCVESP